MTQTYRFHFRFGFTVFWLFFFCLFCALGVWQYHRYQYKKNLLALYETRMHSSAKNLNDVLPESDLMFQPVKVIGTYLNNETMFQQNQFYNDKLGFEVLTPFKLADSDKLLLIDRGWIEKTSDTVSPHVPNVQGKQIITGHIKLLNEYQFILGDNILQPEVSPIILQRIDMKDIEKVTHQFFYPFILRLDANQPNGFVRDWTITNVMPERHLGYTIQWFAMAIVLLIAYFCFCIERVKQNEKS